MKTLEHTLCRIRSVTLLLFLGLFLFVPSVSGATSEQTVTLTQQEYITLQKNLIMLENTIDSQLNTIEELQTQLSIAKASTSEQSQQVIELQNILREQKQQLTEARSLLEMQNKTLQMQSESLARAEAYLKMQEQELKKAQSNSRKAKLLNILLGAGVIYLAAK